MASTNVRALPGIGFVDLSKIPHKKVVFQGRMQSAWVPWVPRHPRIFGEKLKGTVHPRKKQGERNGGHPLIEIPDFATEYYVHFDLGKSQNEGARIVEFLPYPYL